ncbi:hypothetical protein, partial [Mycobacterium avium]|uniref:hypothetical protein n=1 Tax=Mycobacterium avium TaxID=1764 RepID=UPI001E2DF9E4
PRDVTIRADRMFCRTPVGQLVGLLVGPAPTGYPRTRRRPALRAAKLRGENLRDEKRCETETRSRPNRHLTDSHGKFL